MSAINRSKHSRCRTFFLYLLFMQMLMQFVFSLLLVGSLFATFSVFIAAYFDDADSDTNDVTNKTLFFQRLYWWILFIFTIFSITKPLEKSRVIYTLIVIVFGVLILMSFGLGALYIYNEAQGKIAGAIIAGITLLVFILPAILNCGNYNIFRYFFGIIALLFLSPMYVNIFITYSIANLQDVSWGNRGSGVTHKHENTKRNLEQFRAGYLILWVFANWAYGYIIVYLTQNVGGSQKFFIYILSGVVVLAVLAKLICAIMYKIWMASQRCMVKSKNKANRNNLESVESDENVEPVVSEENNENEI